METLTSLSTVFGITTELLIIMLSGITVSVLGFAVFSLIAYARDPVRRRLSAAASPLSHNLSPEHNPRDYTGFIDPVARYILPQDGKERARIQKQLIYAGFRSETALPYFYGIKTMLSLGLPLIVFVATRWVPQWTTGEIIFSVFIAAFIGMTGPNLVLERIKEKRLRKLRNGFPDALDLLVVCVEAGLGLGAAIDRVARDLDVSHTELADELKLVNAEMRAGVERPVALRNLADRSGLADIRGLVGLLVQTLRFGTSIADALRVYSEEFRDKRMQKAEEQAAMISTKLIFPLVLCLFPSFFIVAVGPAALRIIMVFEQL